MVKFLRYQKMFRLYELIQPYLKYSLPLENTLPGRSVLVLAPHPDDEAIGCGGSLCLHARAGGEAHIVYCTSDGEPRDGEALAASRILGASGTSAFKYPVESLSLQGTLPEKLAAVFEEKKPEIVFVPFLIDNHVDHLGLNQALIKLGKRAAFDFMIYAYPVWFPLYPNVLIDIGDVWAQKERAIGCYRSQLATRDYIGMSRSLGQYWAGVKGRNLQVVESFFRATFREYAALGEKLYG